MRKVGELQEAVDGLGEEHALTCKAAEALGLRLQDLRDTLRAQEQAHEVEMTELRRQADTLKVEHEKLQRRASTVESDYAAALIEIEGLRRAALGANPMRSKLKPKPPKQAWYI
eukprot:gnl/Chilomastix_caulleri/1337.p1 GENE.gnl/Chilomastix_caulleri/1337~~gnl/Chilomastix_caulleri/1337.p1  ORF type:complete len:114 (+),score=29.70 gnl/Chilomastix_caulleri/1337:358-699(+)